MGNLREKGHLEVPGVGGIRIVLKRILKKWGERVTTGLIWLKIGTNGSLF